MPITATNADAAYRAGLAALDSGDEAAAIPGLLRAAAANSDDARLWQVLGLLHRALDQLAAAVDAFERAAKLRPKDPLIIHGLARCRLEGGLSAVDQFLAAERLAPADGSVKLGLAAALLADHRGNEAIALLDRALVQQPGWFEGHWVLTRLRWMLGERDTFTVSLDNAIARDPNNIGLWQQYLAALIHAEHFDAALSLIGKGRRHIGQHILFDLNEPGCLDELGDWQGAAIAFDRVGPIDDPGFGVRHVRHLLRGRMPERAARVIDRFLQTPSAFLFWPYASISWRMTGDRRSRWFEGASNLVSAYDLPLNPAMWARIASIVRTFHQAEGQPLDQSARGGTQTEGMLLSRIEPEIAELRAAIIDVVEQHIAKLPPPDPSHPTLSPRRDRRIRFSGSWSIRLCGGGHHVNHVHPGAWLSSALYLALPNQSRGDADRAGWLSLGQPPTELALDIPPTQWVEPKIGRLVLFPSTMWHGTKPFPEGERLSIAFDVAPPPR